MTKRRSRAAYSGAVIMPGNSAASRLIRLVSGPEEKTIMPPAGQAADRAGGRCAASVDRSGCDLACAVCDRARQRQSLEGRQHWSFQPDPAPQPPRVRTESWARNPIDRFILARLEEEGIEPSPEARKTTLIRRVSLDLTGLPPSPSERLQPSSPTTGPTPMSGWSIVCSTRRTYGEKWARQWLDLARYADSDGYEKDYERPHAWRYRHWVIDAFNRDMPFDQFTIEQIAGDLLAQRYRRTEGRYRIPSQYADQSRGRRQTSNSFGSNRWWTARHTAAPLARADRRAARSATTTSTIL